MPNTHVSIKSKLDRLFGKFVAKVEKSVDHPLFIWTVALAAAADLFVIVFPVDWVIISTTILRKRKGFELAIACAFGSAIGACALAWIANRYGLSAIDYFMKGMTHSARWNTTARQVNQYGAWALAFVSVGPLPHHPAVILCGMAEISMLEIFTAVFVARSVKYCFLAWAAVNAPGVLKKLGMKKALEQKKFVVTDTRDDGPQREP